MITRMLAAALFAAALSAPPVFAQDKAAGDNIVNKIINQPSPGGFSVYNAPSPAKVIKDAKVQGGQALRVVIPGADPQPWKITLSDPIQKPVAKGDTLVLAFWARVEKGDNGGTTAHLPNNSIQLAKDPYTGIFGGPIDIGPDWKMYNLKGTADRDYAAGELSVSLQLASGKQTLDFGPIFVLDMNK